MQLAFRSTSCVEGSAERAPARTVQGEEASSLALIGERLSIFFSAYYSVEPNESIGTISWFL